MSEYAFAPADIANYENLLGLLAQNSPPAVTFEQIEETMALYGLDPSLNEALYSQLITGLEQRDIVVVESLTSDEWLDEDAEDLAAADEVMELLNSVTVRNDLFRHALLSARDERRLLEIYQDGKRAEAELSEYSSRAQRVAIQQRIEAAEEAMELLIRHNVRLVAQYLRQIRDRKKEAFVIPL
jgi:hypothetical protein